MLDKLSGSDRRSIGRADEVVAGVLQDIALFGAVQILYGYLQDRSKIVKTFSMQALADLALIDASLRPRVESLLVELMETGSSAMRSRGRKLLARLAERT